MKKLTTIVLVALIISYSTSNVTAQTGGEATASPTASEKTDTIKDKIEDLKERLATRVAELRAKNKRAYYGVIKTKEDANITMVVDDRDIPMVTDKDTVYFTLDANNKKKEAKPADIKAGQFIAAFGSLDLDQKTLIVKVIISHDLPRKINGVVKEIDVNEGTFIVTSKTNTYTFDYEITTRCKIANKNFELTNCGLSKIKAGDRVFIRALTKDETIDQLKAQRILVLPSNPSPTVTP